MSYNNGMPWDQKEVMEEGRDLIAAEFPDDFSFADKDEPDWYSVQDTPNARDIMSRV